MGMRFAAVSVAGAVVLGGLGVAAVNPLGVAGAQPEPEAPASAPHAGQGPLARALEQLVADGTITPDQADAVAAATEDQVATSRAQRREQRAERHRELVAVIAEALGSSPAQVRSSLRDGTSIAEQAEAAGVERQMVDDAITALLAERIETARRDGRIDERRAAKATERLDAAVDRILDADGRNKGPGDGRRFGPRQRGGGPGAGGD
jgi:hypothetical protein